MTMPLSWREDPNDPVIKLQREAREQAVAREEGRKKNVALFQKMYLSIGSDVTVLHRHKDELEEALNLASHRWSRLWDLEAEAGKTGLKDLKDQARTERKALESLRVDGRK
jgi:hypothetical protein